MNRTRLEAFSDGVLAIIITIMVALIWLIPDKRIEIILRDEPKHKLK